MKIIIDIPDKIFHRVCQDYLNYTETTEGQALKAISEGTPLPRGHGRLGDLDALQKEISSWGMNDYEPSDFIDVIDGTDTIIEADKEEGK